ncbi:MAG: GDSL-type esterase/lipase family protein [Acidobacteria bacterium]|nr:GDSL-type esterase/lipase family protein [Acidobacteriota bacterium]MDA1235734.1 GDSL-type esterase/lipase family protein [Acidobacteriota bacterium]
MSIRSAGWRCRFGILLLCCTASSVLLAQDLPDPARLEAAIQRFEAQDKDNPPPRGAIVLTGSSSITRWNDQSVKDLAPLTVIPRGFGGSVMNDVLYYLDRIVLEYEPRAVVIYEGDNDTDISRAIPGTVILDQLSRIIARIHEALPETRIYVLSVKPSVRRWNVWRQAQDVSAAYREIANKDPLVSYVDVATPFLDASGNVMTDVFVKDNLHHNELGTLIWGSAIRAALMPQEARYE